MSLKGRIVFLVHCIRKVVADMKQLSKGQKSHYDLLQLSHRLEKGLLIKNPKPLWGWEKAYRIVGLLQKNKDEFSSTTANAVLSAFLDAKSSSSFKEDVDEYKLFMQKTSFTPTVYDGIGGTMVVRKTVFPEEERRVVKKLFESRHSCREFIDKTVSVEDVKKAVNMALRCPSACNRQPFKVYVIEPAKLEEELGKRLQYKGDKTLIITGDLRAFSPSETPDWLISPSIFAGYLTLSLHSLGIGSCVVRKDLVKPSAYNDAIRTVTGMSDSECIVLEMFVGYYPNELAIPVSNRMTANEVVKFI